MTINGLSWFQNKVNHDDYITKEAILPNKDKRCLYLSTFWAQMEVKGTMEYEDCIKEALAYCFVDDSY